MVFASPLTCSCPVIAAFLSSSLYLRPERCVARWFYRLKDWLVLQNFLEHVNATFNTQVSEGVLVPLALILWDIFFWTYLVGESCLAPIYTLPPLPITCRDLML